MSIGIVDVTNESERKAPAATELGGRAIEIATGATEMGARRIHEEYPAAIADAPAETTKLVGENNEVTELEKIPGVKEVTIKPANENDARPAAFMDPATGKPLKFSMQQFIRDTMNGGMINQLVRKYDLEGIDIEKEAELVEQKKSKLSASKRKAVVALNNMRKQQQKLLADIGKELMHKDNPTDEDLRALLDSVEDATTNTQEVAQAVAKDIVQRSVNQIMEDVKVDYTPGEGGNDKVTAKALHDAVEIHGRAKFRGVFDSLDQVEDPQVGDVIHIIVPDDKGNHSGKELVYTYFGLNYWKPVGSYIQEELPGPVPEEPAKEEDGSIPLTIGE